MLEQSNIEKDKDIERLNQNNASKSKDIERLSQMVNNLIIEFEQTKTSIPLIICNGVHVWRFGNFMESLKLMKEKKKKFYTPGFLTSAKGYK